MMDLPDDLGPLVPIAPVPADLPAGDRPRRWEYPLADICRGAVIVAAPCDAVERFPGDYGGDGWTALGHLGAEIRCEHAGESTDGTLLVRVQYRPENSPRFPEELIPGGKDGDVPAE